MAKKKDVTEERIAGVEEALSKTEQFIESNQKIITYVVIGIVAVIMLFFLFRKFVQIPREEMAQEVIFQAQTYFGADSLDLALYGDGESYGFLDVADEYGSTKAGNLAKYYAGICYLNKGEYENAIDYLKKFDGSDVLVSAMALGAMGDAYMELGDTDKAIEYYIKASEKNSNEFTTPAFLMKAGWAYELQGEYSKAIEVFEELKKDFPKAREARDIDKYIARNKARVGEL